MQPVSVILLTAVCLNPRFTAHLVIALPTTLAFLRFHGTALHVEAVLERVPGAFYCLNCSHLGKRYQLNRLNEVCQK